MSVGTTAATATSEDGGTAGAHELGGAAPYCAACGAWVGIFAPGDGWRHSLGHTALNGTRLDPGHEVDLAWCLPPARSVSPAQLGELLAALDDAIAYREHASSSGYATAYRVLRRQLAGPLRPGRG